MDHYITTAIPFVNGEPHLGHALELVHVDAIGRWHRGRGRATRTLTGTDDNALKNVQAARAAGRPVASFVAEAGDRFVALAAALDCTFDDVIRTATDPRHAPGVERLWRACAAAGDLYRAPYEGRYCAGCEAFVDDRDLVAGRCAEHDAVPETVIEENWFFRLSRYADVVAAALDAGALSVLPAPRAAEVRAWCRQGVPDLSVSRPAARSGGWGVPVPDDPSQVVYVWFDALANYITALGYGTDDPDFARWWGAGTRRVHVVGKGIVRFHALVWPALLASAGVAGPDVVAAHDYLTVAGRKIAKSRGSGTAGAAGLVARYGADAVRWWLLRAVPPVGDTDFTEAALVARADADLANGVGNLVGRVVTLVQRARHGVVPSGVGPAGYAPGPAGAGRVRAGYAPGPAGLVEAIDTAVAAYDLRAATGAVVERVAAVNRDLERTQPWVLARAEAAGDREASARLDVVLADAVTACRQIAVLLEPFTPALAARAAAALGTGDTVGTPGVLFPRLLAAHG